LLREYRLVSPKRDFAEAVWLASFTTDEIGGRLSSDGRRLLYAGNQKGNFDIWIKDLTTGVPKRLTDHVAEDTQPAWSPDERRIAFVSLRTDVKGDIFLYQDGDLTALTDRSTADAFPAFAPDGRSLYFASGPEGQSRVERLDLGSRERAPLTGWGATHPAPSPDGRYLAYTQFDEEGRGRIALLRLGEGGAHLLTTPEHHAGFPTFSADGSRLFFARFVNGPPGKPLTTDAVASLWEVEVSRALSARDPAEAMALARPITSGRYTALFPQATRHGIAFTTQRAGSLDIGLLPLSGPVPRLGTAKEQLALAQAQDDPRDQLLGLYFVSAAGPSAEASAALYRSVSLYRDLGEFENADRILRRLVAESPRRHGDISYLAAIDSVTLEMQRRRAAAATGGKPVSEAEIDAAGSRLSNLPLPAPPSPAVAAHLLLRRADLLRLGERREAATQTYEALLHQFPEQRERDVEARFRLGQLFARIPDPGLQSRYFLTLFGEYPEQSEWLRRAAEAVLTLQAEAAVQGRRAGAATAEAEALRALVDSHRDKPLFCALARQRMAALYESAGRLDLAIQASHEVTERYAGLTKESTRAAFELGRLCLAESDRLRHQGRLSEALTFYGQALSAYERIVNRYEPGHEHHERARTEYLRLSLLQAAQLERDKEIVLAEKQYHKMLALDPDMVQAHRKLIQFGVARGESGALRARYEKRLRQAPGDFIGHYALGYLATLERPLGAGALSRAETQLQRAVELNPQSPFGHMTLGWVTEMRERYLGQTFLGLLEEAIVLYDRAFGLNDARVDAQTEADLLVNQCTVFANLGNGWRQAYEFCDQREKLNLPFFTGMEEAAFRLTHGRAASAMGRYAVAARALSRALDLARDLGARKLEAEAVARLALNAHLQGDHEGSNRFLAQANEHYRGQGQDARLAGLSRSVAYNLILQGKDTAALAELGTARDLLTRHGVPSVENWRPVGEPGRSTAPFGFDAPDEAHAVLALEGLVRWRDKAWPEILSLLERRLVSRTEALKRRKDEEIGHEILVLQSHIARAQLELGQPGKFHQALEAALDALETLQTDGKTGFAPNPVLFPLQVALAESRAEQVLGDLARGRGDPRQAEATQRLLQALEDRRAAVFEKDKTEILSTRLSLSLWTDLALLSFHAGLVGEVAPSGTARGAVAGKPPRVEERPAARALQALLARGQPLVAAVRLLRRVFEESRPEAPPEEKPEEKRAAAQERGVLAPIFQPLRSLERLRFHVLAGLNLAEVTAALSVPQALEHHATTGLLEELAALCTAHDLGALRFVVSAELASRRGNPKHMQAAVEGFLQRSPLLLEPSSRLQSDLVRRQIFGRAIALALRQDKTVAALAFAEQEERRAFLDDLVSLPPQAGDRGAVPLEKLLESAGRYRTLLQGQDPAAAAEKREAWRARLGILEQEVQKNLADLRTALPRVAALFTVPDFPLADLEAALEPTDVAISAVVHTGRGTLVALRRGAPPVAAPLPRDVAAIRHLLRTNPRALPALLGPVLQQLAQGADRVYVDLGRVDPDLRPEVLLPEANVVRLATLWELLDAHAVRNVAWRGGLVVHPVAATAAETARGLPGFKTLSGKDLTASTLRRPFEEAGVLVWALPVSFGGGEASNVRLSLGQVPGEELHPLHLGRSLGLPLRGHLLVTREARHTPGRARAEQVALTRLIHTMGIASLLVVDSPEAEGGRLGQILKAMNEGLGRTDLVRAMASAKRPRGELALYGYAGLSREAAHLFAEAALKKSVQNGAAAFNARKLPEAVEHLEAALRTMDYLESFTYLDGALLFVANAYTLLEDYGHAVPRMERLLALRLEAVEEARKKGPPGAVLPAQAKWVQAVQSMAWLRMRNEQYEDALSANQQAIDLYQKVKRPLLAQPAYDQRSIIAEKKGDMKVALTFARLSLETAQKVLAQTPKNTAARSTVASAAGRLARLLRMRFSDYRPAMEAARLALDHIPAVRPEELARAGAKVETLKTQARKLEGKALAALKPRLATAAAERQDLAQALEERVGALLEMSRIDSARGDYSRAIEQAEQALSLARASGLPLEDAPLLEVVNNLYYTGRYAQALLTADEGLKQAGKNDLRQIQFYNAKGTVYAALGRTPEALAALGEALRIALRLKNPGETAASHNNLGNALRLAGRFEEARDRFAQALSIDRQQKDRLGLAFDLANLGLTEELLGRARDARATLEQALALSREIGAPLNELKALAGLGRLDLSGGKAAAGLKRFREGLALCQRLGLRNWSWRFHLLSGRALRRQGDRAAARTALTQGLGLIEDLAPRQPKALGAPKIEEEPEDLYDELVELLAETDQAEAALDLSERMRARSFVDRMSQATPRLPFKDASPLLARMTALEQELEAARVASSRATTPGEVAAAAEDVSRVKAALEQTRTALAALNPGLPSLVTVDAWPLKRLRPLLPAQAGTRVVVYHLTDQRLVLWTLEGGAAVQMKVVPVGRRTLAEAVTRFRDAMLRYQAVEELSQKLYGWLVAPVLAGRSPSRIVLVPSGPLHLLPFAALHDGRDYLVGRVAVTSLPSLNALRHLSRALATSGRRVSVGWTGDGAEPLSFVPRETEAFGKAFPGATLLEGPKATRARVLAEAQEAEIIHLATHARYDEETPVLSALALFDGPLPLLEILGLKLQASLVILSACETGVGQLDGADGVVGLHQAFLIAGARRVLSSLFRVSDMGTALLMKHLFRRLARGEAAEEALRGAQNDLRRRFPHPAFWAGFRLDGAQ
jgi:CHAT domain-containing protein